MDSKTLWKKAAAKAALAPGNMISGAVALAASAALWNPLPLILWGLGATGWVSLASQAQRYHKVVMAEEHQAARAQALADRGALLQRVQNLFTDPQVAAWVRRGLLPDYLAFFRRLSDIREKVGNVLADRPEMDEATAEGILQQLDYMLGAYLQFVRERISYLQLLANVQPGGPDVEETPALPTQPPPLPVYPMPNSYQRSGKAQARPPESLPAEPPPKVEQRLAEIDVKIKALKELAQREPATARTREWHVSILEKQRELLLDCQRRDQCVVAQLGAFPDAFEVILARVSASQFSATEISSYMGGVVEQIEETERFVASLRPAVDQLMGGMAGV